MARRSIVRIVATVLLCLVAGLTSAGAGERFSDNGDGTVTDHQLNVMWSQTDNQGDISWKQAEQWVRFTFPHTIQASYDDWRLPTLEEAMSLLEPVKNGKGTYLNESFSREQPFIFVAAQRKPGGYWFVDYKQGRAFWSSGTIPGGFGRLVRSVG